MTTTNEDPAGHCFLCEPDEGLIYMRAPGLFAMLGYGPIGEGYSIISTVAHAPSILDLDRGELEDVTLFTREVRDRLRPLFGEAVVTEHGRVAPCVVQPTRAHEAHCLHAHCLVFPGVSRLDVRALASDLDWSTLGSLAEAREHDPGGQYLVCEQADGEVALASVTGPLPRQFFRSVAAVSVGRPELADWRRVKGEQTIGEALGKLKGGA